MFVRRYVRKEQYYKTRHSYARRNHNNGYTNRHALPIIIKSIFKHRFAGIIDAYAISTAYEF